MRAKQRFLEWSHDHETETAYLTRMEARCAPGGNSPSGRSTTVYIWLCYVSIQQAICCLFIWECVFAFRLNQRQNLAHGFILWFHEQNVHSLKMLCDISQCIRHTIMKQYTIWKCACVALTYGQAESPAGLTLYLPNSGGGQGHSARSVSAGTQDLWDSHAEQKIIKHLLSNKTYIQAALLLWFVF